MKLRNILEGEKNEENFNPEEYINLYTCVPPRPARGRLSRVASSLARSIEDALKEKKAPNEFRPGGVVERTEPRRAVSLALPASRFTLNL